MQKKGFQEKHKITDHWEKDPYEVMKQRQDGLLVFVVANNGHKRVLHHSMFSPAMPIARKELIS